MYTKYKTIEYFKTNWTLLKTCSFEALKRLRNTKHWAHSSFNKITNDLQSQTTNNIAKFKLNLKVFHLTKALTKMELFWRIRRFTISVIEWHSKQKNQFESIQQIAMPFSELLLHSSSFTAYILYFSCSSSFLFIVYIHICIYLWETGKRKIYKTRMSQVRFIILLFIRHESQEETEHCTDHGLFIHIYFKSNVTKKNLCSKLNSNQNRKYLSGR